MPTIQSSMLSEQAVDPVDESSIVSNVLIVDDHKDSLLAMRAALAPLEQNLVECNSGEDALRRLLKEEYAVIILDVRLPGMDGFEIAEIIRERPKSCRTPIIFLTGLSKDQPQVFHGYSLGAVDYLIKPIDANILRAKVKVFVDLFCKTEQVRRQTEHIFLLREQELAKERERERIATEHEILVKEKEAAEALAQKATELQRSNEELKQFAYIASHDLQEPVRTITSFSDLMIAEYENDLSEEARHYLKFINSSAKRMTTLIKGLLEHSRIGRELNKEWIDCRALIESVTSDLAASIQASKARIELNELPSIYASEPDIYLLFANLLSNAIKFRKPKISPEIIVSSQKNSDCVEIIFKDNGIGIDKRHLAKIFNIFQRGSAHDQIEGSGIGLAHCRKIVEIHGGSIWAASQKGKGSEFHITIPHRHDRDRQKS